MNKIEKDQRGPIPGAVVGQYFGIFNGVPKDHYKAIVDAAPFDHCNLLIIAFVHAALQDGKYIAQFKNERDNGFACTSDDDDKQLDKVHPIGRQSARRCEFQEAARRKFLPCGKGVAIAWALPMSTWSS